MFGRHTHGTEFEDLELASVLGDAGLAVEDRTGRAGLHQDRGDEHDWRRDDQGDQRQQNVKEPFDNIHFCWNFKWTRSNDRLIFNRHYCRIDEHHMLKRGGHEDFLVLTQQQIINSDSLRGRNIVRNVGSIKLVNMRSNLLQVMATHHMGKTMTGRLIRHVVHDGPVEHLRRTKQHYPLSPSQTAIGHNLDTAPRKEQDDADHQVNEEDRTREGKPSPKECQRHNHDSHHDLVNNRDNSYI